LKPSLEVLYFGDKSPYIVAFPGEVTLGDSDTMYGIGRKEYSFLAEDEPFFSATGRSLLDALMKIKPIVQVDFQLYASCQQIVVRFKAEWDRPEPIIDNCRTTIGAVFNRYELEFMQHEGLRNGQPLAVTRSSTRFYPAPMS
jgi:hypothetical protein